MRSQEFFANRHDASAAAAERIAAALKRDLDAQGAASLIAGGGSTPRACYRALASEDLAWENVTVVPSDERCVPASHEASNERMLRENLLIAAAGRARFVPLYRHGLAPPDQCAAVTEDLSAVPVPHSIALLGMGEDGHFASLFPDLERLGEGLDPAGTQRCLPVTTAASPHPRLTLTLAALTDSREILLLLFGETKRAVYERAAAGTGEFPVSRLLAQGSTPVHVIWAP